MYTITKQFTFDASHVLEGLPEGHKCGRMHGHTYTVIVELESLTLDDHGFVQDYNELSLIKTYIDEFLDHRHLNDTTLLQGINPTAENIAFALYHIFKSEYPLLKAIGVKETPKTFARYAPQG